MIDGVSGFNTFYKYGPTSRNPTPHYCRFLFDGRTGAEFLDDRIVIHLRDGERGDDDLTANGIIVDPGAPVINNSSFPHRNPISQFDVNEDNQVTALDALVVINRLNETGGIEPLPVPIVDLNLVMPFYDVNGDNLVSPIDALQIINELNRLDAAAESIEVASSTTLEQVASDVSVLSQRRIAANADRIRTRSSDVRLMETEQSPSSPTTIKQQITNVTVATGTTATPSLGEQEENHKPSATSLELVDDYFAQLKPADIATA